MRLILHFHCSLQITSIRWRAHLNCSWSPYINVVNSIIIIHYGHLSSLFLAMLFSCCMIFCGMNLSRRATRWLLLHCLLPSHDLFTHYPHHLTKSWITLIRFGRYPVCLCLNFYRVHCPRGVAWDDFGCTVCLHRVNLFNHCPCLLARLWIEMGLVQIHFNCHTIFGVIHCPLSIAPHEVAWDNFGCDVFAFIAWAFSTICPCLLAK